VDYGLGITNWNEWMKKHHIKIATQEEAMRYQDQKSNKKRNKVKIYISNNERRIQKCV
jgi:hypothetical protein